MNEFVVKIAKSFFKTFGYELQKINHRDFSENEIEIIQSVKLFTQTSSARIVSLIHSVEYVIKNNIPGSIVECGVWKGGSMMATIKALQNFNQSDHELYLFDTFEGMPKPTDVDISLDDYNANNEFSEQKISEQSSSWNKISLLEVKKNVLKLGYDEKKIHFIKGMVEQTIPKYSPKEISILRLDTDWYESTKHELIHLFPRLSNGGVLIIDDYGFWKGSKKAVDEYFFENKIPFLLNRIDNTGRIGIKI